MKNQLKILFNNLSKTQKIILFIIFQIIIIIILIFIIKKINEPKNHIITQNNDILSQIPNEEKKLYEESLWNIINKSVKNIDKNIINDIFIRRESFQKTEKKDNKNNIITTVSFLIDIDSIQQTYEIILSWSSNKIYNTPIINCPPQAEMKYKETICYGSYNNTYSLELYLPYLVYPENKENSAPNYSIYGDENTKIINISVSACNPEKYKQQALDYLNTTPIKLDEYQINYKINNIDIEC